MNLYSLFAICFIPTVTCFILFCILVPGFKIYHGLWALLIGLFTVVPIAILQFFILNLPVFNTNTFTSLLVTAFIFNGLIEETVKMIFMFMIPYRKKTVKVFFASSLLCGLVLGSFESVIYLIKRFQESGLPTGADAALKLILIRTFTAVILHTFCAGLSGLYVWMFRHKTRHTAPFIYAALLHGVYNFFAGFSTGYKWFSVVAILFAILECRIWYKNIIQPDTGVDIKKKSR